jgi:hypothetical protein
MKACKTLVAAAFIALSLATQAETAAQFETNMGRSDGVFAYCERIDPTLATTYKLLSAPFAPGQAPAVILQERLSATYKSALASEETALDKLPVSAGLSACKLFLTNQGVTKFPSKPGPSTPRLP